MTQYSSLFTLGLLSGDHANKHQSLSLPPQISIDLGFYAPASSSTPSSPRNKSKPMRSFLSLDLPATNHLAPPTSPARATSPRTPSSPFLKSPHRTISRQPSRERDSLRTLPSPKPAPSASLPSVPVQGPHPTPPFSSRTPASPVHPMPTLSSSARPSRSYPPKTRLTRAGSVLSTGTSVRTARKQAVHRDAALANLEGRGSVSPSPSPSPSRTHPSHRPRNFMSMSDEEDEEEARNGDGEDVFKALPTDVRPIPPVRSRSNSAAGSMGRKRGYSLSGASGKRTSVSSLASTLANFLDFRDDEGMGLAVRAV